MADLTIYLSEVSPYQNKIRVGGLVYVSPSHGPYPFFCEHEWGEISVNINKSIRDMAVAEAQLQGHPVNANDRKTIYGGPADAQGA
jgi:hypothetical protein